ncbi:hypothetical protein KGQ24_03190 [Patescibacteria group bacterium]|nr:hypothetical protein [Patescibacteria group bacterium]
MNNEHWNALVEQAKKNFSDVAVSTEDLTVETGEGFVKQGSIDVLEFTNDAGTFKLVRENRPVILDKKMHYSHRQGDSARTEYVLSDTEFSHKLLFYKQDDYGDWHEIESANLQNLL